MKLLATLALIIVANTSFANNVVPVQHELREDQIEYIQKWNTKDNYGIHQNFAWIRVDGEIFSVSMNEYRKSKYYRTHDLLEYMTKYYKSKVDEEAKELQIVYNKAIAMITELVETGMTIQQAVIIAKYTFEGFGVDADGPYMSSKNVTVRG